MEVDEEELRRLSRAGHIPRGEVWFLVFVLALFAFGCVYTGVLLWELRTPGAWP